MAFMAPAPEQLVERSMIVIRRQQSRRVLTENTRQQGFSASLITTAEILDDIDESRVVGRDRTVTGIAHRLRMDQPRVSRLVAEAITHGLLERVADQGDGRRSLLALTALGDTVLEGIRRNRQFLYHQAMADWSADERSTFADLLSRFVAKLD